MKLNEAIVMFCAFRYALGRQTYVVSAIAEELKRRVGEFSAADRRGYVEDIERAASGGNLGADFDVAEWMAVRDVMLKGGTHDAG